MASSQGQGPGPWNRLPSLFSGVSHSCQSQLPVWWRGAGSGAALSRRLSRKSREGPPGADLPRLERPAVPGLRNRVWLLYSCTGGESLLLPEWRGAAGVTPVVTPSNRATSTADVNNNGTTPPTWGRPAHVRKSNIAEKTHTVIAPLSREKQQTFRRPQ